MTGRGDGFHRNEADIPAELRDVASLADRLGARERANAPKGLNDRLVAGALRELAAPQLTLVGEGSVRANRGNWLRLVTPSRLAAAVVLAGAMIATWAALSTQTRTTSTSGAQTQVARLQDDLELLYTIRTPDSEWNSLASDLDLLSVDAELIAARDTSTDWLKSDEGTM